MQFHLEPLSVWLPHDAIPKVPPRTAIDLKNASEGFVCFQGDDLERRAQPHNTEYEADHFAPFLLGRWIWAAGGSILIDVAGS